MEMKYFDWTATTRPSERVIEAVTENLAHEWGNPSSVHGMGNVAKKRIDEARRSVLRGLGFGREAPGRLIFTSGGTEANNLALLGAAYAKERRGRILITEGEHASVEMCARQLEADGFEVVRITTRGGELDLDAIREIKNVAVASFMTVNNETGAVYDIAGAAKAVRENSPDAFIHTDAVQAFMKLRFTPERLGVNAVSVSAHKLGGLKGTGALYVDRDSLKRKRLTPRILGGGQEDSLRSGTENVCGIVAFGEAVREAMESFAARSDKTAMLRALLEERLAGTPLRINQPKAALPGIVSVTVPGIKSETVLNFANERGFCISAGSACSSHGHGMSQALVGFGISEADADSTVRISLSHLNTEDEVAELAATLTDSLTLAGSTRRQTSVE